MARNRKTTVTIIGLALLVVGIGLAFWGYQLSGSVGSRLSEAFTGAAVDAVMIRYIGGAACVAVGLYLLIKK